MYKSRKVGDTLKPKRKNAKRGMKEILNKSFNKYYADQTSINDINNTIKYLRGALKDSKKSFEKRGLGDKMNGKIDDVLSEMRLNKNMTKRQRVQIIADTISMIKKHRLTPSLFDEQKKWVMESINSKEYSTIVDQSREMHGKKMILNENEISDKDFFDIFDAVDDIRDGITKFEKDITIGSGDELKAAAEVVYSRKYENDYKYNSKLSLGQNIVSYLRQANTDVRNRSWD